MSGYKESDAAKDTKVRQREVEATWHQARDDAQVRSGGAGDQPTEQNRDDARRLERKVMDRARARTERPRSDR